MKVRFLDKDMPDVTLTNSQTLRLAFLKISDIRQSEIYDSQLSRDTPKIFSRLILAISLLPILIVTFSLELTNR